MSDKIQDELSDREFLDVTKLIKVISDSVRSYLESIKDSPAPPSNDISLYAMQVLSLMCGLSRGYSKDQLDKMWQTSTKLSNKIHASRNNDKATGHQTFLSRDNQFKN